MNKERKDQHFFFHLGLPKTASTFLQVVVFPQLEGIEYFRKRKFKHFKSLGSNSTAHKILFTTESDRGFEKKLKSVADTFSNIRIVLVFRRHDKWILSKYKYYIRKHGHVKFEDFFNLEKNDGLWKIEELYFAKYIDLVKQYTHHPPLVLTFEELEKDHQLFIKKITDFLGIALPSQRIKNKTIKKSFSNKQLIFLRKFNTLYRYKELKTSSRFLNKIHYKYREFLLHIIAFFAQIIPSFFIGNQVLISTTTLAKIASYYEEDWLEICTQT